MLKINEIFSSIQGESSFAGFPFVFVRLAGCNLRCKYCDTKYAYEDGDEFSIDDVIQKVLKFEIPKVCLTGGEPLLQSDSIEFLERLILLNMLVTLETNGSIKIDEVNKGVHVVLDLKTPGSVESDKNLYKNLQLLKKKDEVKFVITDRNDYNWAIEIMRKFDLTENTNVLFSPCSDSIEPKELANWMVKDKLNARFNLQLHKIIWGNLRGK